MTILCALLVLVVAILVTTITSLYDLTIYKKYTVPTSLVTQNSMYFPGYFQVKAMKFKVNLASNQCLD